jgi:hypothetical protein
MQNSSRRSSKTITKTTYFSDIASIPTARTFSDDNNNVCKTNRKMHLSLTGVVSDINKKKFIDQNKQALKTYDNMLKNIRQKKKIVITSKTKDITEHNSKFLLTAFDFNSIITNEEDFEKKKKINKFKLRGFKSNVIGVDEHLIELPKINDEFRINHYQSHNTFYNLNGINTIKKNNIYEYNRTDYNDNSLKRKRFVSPFPKSGSKDLYSPRKMKNKNLFTSSPIRKEKISHSLNNNAKNSKQVENIKKNSIKNQLSTNDTEFSKVDPQMINEIKKLNQWDRKHAVNVYKGTYRPSLNMQIFLNSLGQSSNQWLMDIKADPKQIEILSRNKHLKNFFTKIDKEQKAISYQSVSLYKKGFNFDIFNENKNKKRSSSDDTDQFLAQVDVYREIMRERMKIEEFLKNDLSEISQQLYDLKLEKKSLIISLFETSNDINDIFKEITALKGEYEQKKINLEEEYEIFKKESFQIQPTARRSNKYYKKNKHNKEELFLHRNKIIGNKAELDQELRGKLDSLNENKSILDYKIGHLNDQLYETNEKIRKIKLKLNQRYKALINYYLDILSKGIDVRRNGLVWCVIRLISLKAFFTYENFPVFLTHEQIDYMIKIAYMQHEINELIGLFQILKKKQKELREDQILQQELLFKEKEEQMRKGKKQSISTIQNLIGKIERVAKKYEHVMNICLNEKKDDEHLSQICKNLHEKIISLHNEIELEEQSSENIELYFLPGSLAEFFNKNSKYRIYFDDILYLNKEISIKEKEISSLKDQQLKTYRKNYNNSNHSVQDELIFAALFGNGITV